MSNIGYDKNNNNSRLIYLAPGRAAWIKNSAMDWYISLVTWSGSTVSSGPWVRWLDDSFWERNPTFYYASSGYVQNWTTSATGNLQTYIPFPLAVGLDANRVLIGITWSSGVTNFFVAAVDGGGNWTFGNLTPFPHGSNGGDNSYFDYNSGIYYRNQGQAQLQSAPGGYANSSNGPYLFSANGVAYVIFLDIQPIATTTDSNAFYATPNRQWVIYGIYTSGTTITNAKPILKGPLYASTDYYPSGFIPGISGRSGYTFYNDNNYQDCSTGLYAVGITVETASNPYNAFDYGTVRLNFTNSGITFSNRDVSPYNSQTHSSAGGMYFPSFDGTRLYHHYRNNLYLQNISPLSDGPQLTQVYNQNYYPEFDTNTNANPVSTGQSVVISESSSNGGSYYYGQSEGGRWTFTSNLLAPLRVTVASILTIKAALIQQIHYTYDSSGNYTGYYYTYLPDPWFSQQISGPIQTLFPIGTSDNLAIFDWAWQDYGPSNTYTKTANVRVGIINTPTGNFPGGVFLGPVAVNQGTGISVG